MKGRSKRDNKAKYLLILLLLIAVGYAAIATTLKINGSSSIKSARWDVYWENPQVLSGSVTNTVPTLEENDTKATFNVTLNEPGDYYEFTIDAVNNGSLDAKIDTNGIVKQVKNSSGEVVTPTILKYEVTNNDQEHTAIQEGHILAKKSGNTPTKETYRVRVEYRNDEGINPSDLDDTNDLVFTIEFSVKYVQGPKAEPEPDLYSMEVMCPGCVFTTDDFSINFGGLATDKITTDYNTLGDRFLGYILGTNTELAEARDDPADTEYVLREFACGKEDGKYFCVEGYDTSKYDNNVDILNHFFSQSGQCSSEGGEDWNGTLCTGNVKAEVDSFGYVWIKDVEDDYSKCSISGDGGEAQCN